MKNRTDREVYGRECSVCKDEAKYLATYYEPSPRFQGSRTVLPLCGLCLSSLVDTTTPPWKFREMDWWQAESRAHIARIKAALAAENVPPMLPGTEDR